MKKYMFLTVNVIVLFVIFFCLLYANTYVNDHIVPDSLLWRGDQPRLDKIGMLGVASIKSLALLVEGFFCVLTLYFLHRLTTTDTNAAIRFFKLNLIITLIFILIVICGSFRVTFGIEF